MTKIQCDGKYSTCKRGATVTIPAGAFLPELHFCKTHKDAFVQESAAFNRRNALWQRTI